MTWQLSSAAVLHHRYFVVRNPAFLCESQFLYRVGESPETVGFRSLEGKTSLHSGPKSVHLRSLVCGVQKVTPGQSSVGIRRWGSRTSRLGPVSRKRPRWR